MSFWTATAVSPVTGTLDAMRWQVPGTIAPAPALGPRLEALAGLGSAPESTPGSTAAAARPAPAVLIAAAGTVIAMRGQGKAQMA